MPPNGPPPASARPILERDAPRAVAGGFARLRVLARSSRPEALVSGMVLLIGAVEVPTAWTRFGDSGTTRAFLQAPFARNGSGELLFRGLLRGALGALDR